MVLGGNVLGGGGGGELAAILTVNGDILYRNAAGDIVRLPVGAANEALTVVGGVPAWAARCAVGLGDYVFVRDKKATTVDGGTFTQGAWQTRDINEEVADTGNQASIAANQITLAAGTYRCQISAPAYQITRHQTRLQNITDAATELLGTSEYTGPDDQNRSFIIGRFTIASTKVFEIQHRCQATQITFGFGVAADWTDEIYTLAEFWKES